MKYCSNCNIKISSGSKTGLCIKCSRAAFPVWNKGKKELRADVLDKLSTAKLGKAPPNKGLIMNHDQKVKISCSSQGIELCDFNGLKSSENHLERNKFIDLNLHTLCFEKYKYSCESCGITGVNLNAHHKNSWKFFPEQRFNIDNLTSLCTVCHSDFHKVYGNGKVTANTEDQFLEFKNNRKNHLIKKTVILVAGVSGSGKSWVCNQLDKTYFPFDKIDKKNIRSIIYNSDSPIVVYDPTVFISSFIKRNKDVFNIKLIIIVESEDVIKSRLISRGGAFTANIARRINRMNQIKCAAEFSGTSQEVLDYIKSNY